jgi:hypothetical protein
MNAGLKKIDLQILFRWILSRLDPYAILWLLFGFLGSGLGQKTIDSNKNDFIAFLI